MDNEDSETQKDQHISSPNELDTISSDSNESDILKKTEERSQNAIDSKISSEKMDLEVTVSQKDDIEDSQNIPEKNDTLMETSDILKEKEILNLNNTVSASEDVEQFPNNMSLTTSPISNVVDGIDVSENSEVDGRNDSLYQDEINRPEEVDMENIYDVTEKDKSATEDPFDSMKSSSLAIQSLDASIDNTNHEKYDKDDTESIQLETNAATINPAEGSLGDDIADDIEQGKGVDEELSLLPDAEREISDADKERAILAEGGKSCATTIDTTAEMIPTNENDNRINNETSYDEQDTVSDINDITLENETTDLSSSLKEGEIREIQGELSEHICLGCNVSHLCKFTLLHENETKFFCNIDCVHTFQHDFPSQTYILMVKKVFIIQVADSKQNCIICNENKICKYRIRNAEKAYEYFCGETCVKSFIGGNVEKYVIKKKRYTIEEISETADKYECIQCSEQKNCQFSFKQDDEDMYVCQENCLNLLMKEQPDRFRIKRRSVRVRDLPKRAGIGSATITEPEPVLEMPKMLARTESEAEAARQDREASFVRRCVQCFSVVILNDRSLHWETLDFCNETCLGQYQNVVGAACTTCQNAVTLTSLGKYCVRFGYEIRQFCRSACLDEFKKGLKVCSYCQKDISKDSDGFLASIAGQFKDFCSPNCMKKYDEMCNPKKKNTAGICSVCNNVDQIRVEILVDGRDHLFCSNPCFSAFKFVNNIVSDKCSMCAKFFERKSDEAFTIYQDKTALLYCSKVCMNIYIITNRKIVPCQWCKVKKYNFDMIQKFSGHNTIMLCSLNCLTLCEVSMNAISMKKQKCDQCNAMITPQYHLTMSDASIRNFCTYQCVMSFQSQFSRAPLTLDGELPTANSPVPTGLPKRIKGGITPSAGQASKLQKVPTKQLKQITKTITTKAQATKTMKSSTTLLGNKVPVISNVTSLASSISTRTRFKPGSLSLSLQPVVELEPLPPLLLKKTTNNYGSTKRNHLPPTSPPPRLLTPPPKIEIKTQIVTIPPVPKYVSNMTTMCKPVMENKEVTCRPATQSIGCQTESHLEKKIVIPIPVPIYVPQPLHMYSMPIPIPVPIPLPIPVPIFIPTTRNSANGIMKEIKKIQDKMPTDPFEAELLMMAEMVAGDKKKSESDSGSDDEVEDDYGTETITEHHALGEDMLQMALKMAQEYDEPAVDLESAMTANTITPSSHPHLQYEGDVDDHNAIQHHHMLLIEQQRQAQMQHSPRGRKRASPAQPRNNRAQGTPLNKRARRTEMTILAPQPETQREPIEKADANMCLKFTFGVNAWKQWVMTKNADLEKSSIRRKPFKSELLQLTADELNYSLCLFVKEVRKPNGSEYAPDTIYYLVLGIQQYLYENGRIDNIFTDPYYEKFTDCLDDVAKKFSVLYNDSQYIVTRVEEEHLWECKQLGAHSPHVLLSTLMFFNTKHFNLTTVEEHMQLSFSHIMKHWKRNPNQVGAAKLPGSRNVLLRFYPPQSALENNSRKKKVYEQQENEDNPLRCPVKLYEFYLSKCPESVKTRNDVFYLQPERSCVPDSPVWYSTQALGKESLCKMLHRVKMVKEINIALLTS